ncbi:hypothetical protein BH23ACT6_BH23ACT6_02070 [soil metagenome]
MHRVRSGSVDEHCVRRRAIAVTGVLHIEAVEAPLLKVADDDAFNLDLLTADRGRVRTSQHNGVATIPQIASVV